MPTLRKKDRGWIPQFCGRCHSDAAFMRRFNPALPTDQLAKYRASQHGRLLLGKNDSRAAQCVSCHGVHGIQGVKSPQSKVYPKQIPETCGSCHSNPEVMAGFTLADGSPMPTDQVEKYRDQCARSSAARAWRYRSRGVQRLSRKPRSDAAGRDERCPDLPHLSCR